MKKVILFIGEIMNKNKNNINKKGSTINRIRFYYKSKKEKRGELILLRVTMK